MYSNIRKLVRKLTRQTQEWLYHLWDPVQNEHVGNQQSVEWEASFVWLHRSHHGSMKPALVTRTATCKERIASLALSNFSMLHIMLHQLVSKHKSTRALIGYAFKDLLPGLCLCGFISLWHWMNSLAPRCCYPLTIPVFLIIFDSIFLCPICYCLRKRDVRFP